MAKIALLFPAEQMTQDGRAAAEEFHADLAVCRTIATADAVNEARSAIEEGAQIIVARGYQASVIKKYVQIPIVEVCLTAQEIGLLLKQAKGMTDNPHPHVAIIGFRNMLPDLSCMGSLFDITLDIYYIDRAEDAGDIISRLSQDSRTRPDVLIGGSVCCDMAQKLGILSLFYRSTAESVREAVKTAVQLADALDQKEKSAAQMATILDTSFSGVIRINAREQILSINRYMENVLGKKNDAVVGSLLGELIPEIDMDQIRQTLGGSTERVTTSLNFRNEAWMLVAAPVQYNNEVHGAVISLRKIAELSAPHSRQDMMLRGFASTATFQDIRTSDAAMKKTMEKAMEYALSSQPVLIYAPAGTEDFLLAEAIHNNSDRKAGPFVSINLRNLPPDEQTDMLFRRVMVDDISNAGNQGAMLKADHGTIYIQGAEQLSPDAQQKILRVLLPSCMTVNDVLPVDSVDVRLIISSRVSLQKLVMQGSFSEDLYYLLSGLVLEIPSLNQRPQDLETFFREDILKYSKRYNRHLHITQGGIRKLLELPWNGNLLQLHAFTERLVLTAQKRQIDEVVLQPLFDELYPKMRDIGGEPTRIVYHSREADEIREALRQNGGSREKTAAALGISTTTLWRRMKKFGISAYES